MSKSYEATYESGRLNWLSDKPEIKDGTRVTVLIDSPPKRKLSRDEIRQILDEARGAWGTGKTLEKIDKEIESMREAAWSRDSFW